MATTTLDPAAKVGSQVGRSVPRLEARDKVTGRAEYTHTMRVPGMVHAKIFRSTVAHGNIKSIDTSAAKKVPGVLHVVTVDDVMKVLKSPYYGPAFHDQPILAHEKVRFVGEPVAAAGAGEGFCAFNGGVRGRSPGFSNRSSFATARASPRARPRASSRIRPIFEPPGELPLAPRG